MRLIGVLVNDICKLAGVDPVHHDVGKSALDRREVLDQVVRHACDVAHLAISTAFHQVRAVGQREFVRERRLRAGRQEDVLRWITHAGVRGTDGIVGDIEAWREVVALASRALVKRRDVGRVAHRAVLADLRFVVAAGILTVGGVDHVVAVALHVVGDRQPRHDPVVVDADDAAGRRPPSRARSARRGRPTSGSLIAQWSCT